MGAGGTLSRRDGIPDYAQRFATAGIAALAFDYRHWGDSDGEPRRLLSLPCQLEDWRAAVAHARSLRGVDQELIAVWGMSGGGGHALSTAAADPRIAAVIALVPMADGLAFSISRARRRVVWHALRRRITTGRRAVFAAAGPPGALAFFDEPEALAGFERLTEKSDWRNEMSLALDSLGPLYRPVRRAKQIRAPVLVQFGDHDTMAPRRAVEQTASRAPRGVLRRYPIDHFGCFWPEHIDRIADDQIEFVLSHLLAAS
jgi:dienelactone hydrolase